MAFTSARRELLGDIMKTDIICEVLYETGNDDVAQKALDEAFTMFRTFEGQYSRFLRDNDLWRLNMSDNTTVSPELFDMLTRARYFYKLTQGVFNPSILPLLEELGYRGAYKEYSKYEPLDFSLCELDEKTLRVMKPKNMLIDLGGIGKGYIVDKVADFLETQFHHVLVAAGGDIAVRGTNRMENYPYWVIEVEHPTDEQQSVAFLMLSEKSVATSGRNRRKWMQNDLERHHLIDPSSHASASDELLSVTVIAGTTVAADILAKTLFIAGIEKGMKLAKQSDIPALFVRENGEVIINKNAEAFVWHSSKDAV